MFVCFAYMSVSPPLRVLRPFSSDIFLVPGGLHADRLHCRHHQHTPNTRVTPRKPFTKP